MIVVTGVAWLGVACGPPSEPEPEPTAAVDAEPGPDPEDRPTWKECMADPNCIAGARVQVRQNESEVCAVRAKPWFAKEAEPGVIDADAKGRVFFLVQWHEECQDTDVFYIPHPLDGHPWDNDCHEEPWKRTGQKSFRSFRCEVADHDQGATYRFCLEIADVACERTGGTVRVRGSGKPPAGGAPAP
jgi:hypothetical protein